MTEALRSNKVLVTGAQGFTGQHLLEHLTAHGYDVYGLVRAETKRDNEIVADLVVPETLLRVITQVQPDYIIHLAAVTFVPHGNAAEIYQINLLGTLNLLEAVLMADLRPTKIIIASTSNVYGNPAQEFIDESVCPAPVSHYANSKLAMEYMAQTYFDQLPIVLTRPFNYTGVAQREHFLIPKIVQHFRERRQTIELGNLDVVRDISDIRFVVEAYRRLLTSDGDGQTVNICSAQAVKLLQLIDIMRELSDHDIEVKVNPEFVRKNDIKRLVGSNAKLMSLIGQSPTYSIRDTLASMYYA